MDGRKTDGLFYVSPTRTASARPSPPYSLCSELFPSSFFSFPFFFGVFSLLQFDLTIVPGEVFSSISNSSSLWGLTYIEYYHWNRSLIIYYLFLFIHEPHPRLNDVKVVYRMENTIHISQFQWVLYTLKGVGRWIGIISQKPFPWRNDELK